VATSIRFPVGWFADLRSRLLADLSREAFAVLLGKREQAGDLEVITVREQVFPTAADLSHSSIASVGVTKDFVYEVLTGMTSRFDVDCIIDVHTHPFSQSYVNFSGIDDEDERKFCKFLNSKFDGISYGSIVLSQSRYAARMWRAGTFKPKPVPATIRTQTRTEYFDSTGTDAQDQFPADIFDRTARAVGVGAMRLMASDDAVAVIGVGGLGSAIAENLIHMGFQKLHLIDGDSVEMSNLSRIVGAYYDDAEQRRRKVDVVQEHLQSINPAAEIVAHFSPVEDASIQPVLAGCSWMIVATDNHASRFAVQSAAFRYFVPFISAGVNITTVDDRVTDISGEVIVVRVGDQYCLNCLGRLDPQRMAVESHPDVGVREALVTRGYVTGGPQVVEPAVKTLNATVAAMAVDALVDSYRQQEGVTPILVFERIPQPTMYPDWESLANRSRTCFTCTIPLADSEFA
jgi:molybdopterin-synthase adenylyltransferase